jgi:hypothetical protein
MDFASPRRYPQKYDPARDALFVMDLTQAGYRAASFLDDRILPAAAAPGAWIDAAAVAVPHGAMPLHVIFHAGHVGSTLLSRLIDEVGGVLGVREPLPLRTLAQMHDAGAAAFDARLALFLDLWRRGFADTRAVVVKATSTGGRIAPQVLAASARSRAVYLSLAAEPYLATLLAGANTMTDLRGFEVERSARLRRLSPARWTASSVGELAAMTWAAETLTRARAVAALGERILPLDFEAMLADLPGAMARVLAHLEIAAPPGFAAAVGRSPVLRRYSKAPQQFEYSPHLRAQLLAQARREHAGEIRKGLAFLERLAAQDAGLAALL